MTCTFPYEKVPPLTALAALALSVFTGRSLIGLAAFDVFDFLVFLIMSRPLPSCRLSSVPAAIAYPEADGKVLQPVIKA